MLFIRHETIYHYTAALTYTIQQLRLMPRAEPHQRTQSWDITTSGNRHAFVDAYGNLSHMLTVIGRHEELRIVAQGAIEVAALNRGRLPDYGTLSPLIFTVSTRLTALSPNVEEFAALHLTRNPGSNALLNLAESIRGAIMYQSGATIVTSSAADALQLGLGVCQDHAHVFLACCHTQGIPARYVSGYVHAGDTEHAESHAWVDVWVDETDFSGWISIDVTNAQFASDMHCRLAIGRDYDSAAPVRGVRHGGGEESLSVHVDVSAQ